ncbi:SAM-dependent methyltransferase [Amycolatopsis acidiphila]|uniref:S-adenosyl-L-methionine-dependent methyltransferase n=1 Tax=Amycolatopsis acidiphila TaxID=715473 RepID=A0A557ZTT5_9PSEU|nr:SAM-dependent methyltransferase [Amycolatopsis acidiphila]TVT15412.1 SAM-dependent methyltransferase [Amycolatopsis acidiphila]UIJ59520.1 SAM-dependent methyltransferase [Amycolatopsis acidiphila]GHG80390.1 putative S-adenosyl-L-methionine-dependent methyltransferase [Amycolatopsis acidiphila]
MRDWDIVSGVGITALAVAAARAVESSRAEPLVEDPYAAAFVRAAQAPMPLPTRAGELPREDALWERMSLFLGLRSRFFDEYLAEASTAGVRQVVILAAGLDSRAFRLDWPDETTLFEVDQPRVLEFKDEVLAEQGAQPRCERRTVAVDLRDDWANALLDKGFDPEQPTAWLVEGLLPYLARDAATRLLDTVHSLSALESTVAIEYVHDPKAALEDPAVENMLKEFGFDFAALLPDDPHGDPAEQLAELGWAVGDVSGADLAERYGRQLTDNVTSMFGANGRYLTGRLG